MKGSKQNHVEDANVLDQGTFPKKHLVHNQKYSRQLRKFRKNVTQNSVNDKAITSRKWELFESLLGNREDGILSFLVSWGKERGFYLLGLCCLLACALLFTLQAFMAFRSYQMLHQITTKRHIPDTLYQIYFGGYDWALDLDKVDLRANTSLFMH